MVWNVACWCIVTSSKKIQLRPVLVQFWPSDGSKAWWNWGFRVFEEKCMEVMAWNVACWFTLTTSRNYSFFGQYWPSAEQKNWWNYVVSIGLILAPRWQKYLEVSGLSKKNARKEWPDIRYADVSLPPLETIQFWSLLAQLWPHKS